MTGHATHRGSRSFDTHAHQRLAVALRESLAEGQQPPCAVDPVAWFHPMQTVRDMAVRKCLSLCPLIEVCGEAGQGEEHGVWGGIDHTRRTSKTNPYDS